jgi:Domain of unknown function (DUF4327)
MPTVRELTIADVQDEVRALVTRGSIGRQQRIFELSRFFSDYRWQMIERLLETNDYLLRDRVIDLVGKEYWNGDEG